jgi:hypothetical protein
VYRSAALVICCCALFACSSSSDPDPAGGTPRADAGGWLPVDGSTPTPDADASSWQPGDASTPAPDADASSWQPSDASTPTPDADADGPRPSDGSIAPESDAALPPTDGGAPESGVTRVDVAPDELLVASDPISPSAGAILNVYDQLSVEVPPGAAAKPATLSIAGGIEGGVMLPWKLVESYDVNLSVDGNPVQPTVPITLRFRVFPETLRSDLSAADQLVMAWFDTAANRWNEVPFALDTDASGATWAVVSTPHLTSFAQWIVNYPYSVLSVPGWRIYFDPNTNAVGLGAKSIEELVVAYRGVLDAAHAGYVAAGFPSPRNPPVSWSKVSVYVLPMIDEGAYYNPLTGNISLNALVADDNEARYEASHEVFHLFQNATLNAKSMDFRRWFVEAAASYAGDDLSSHTGVLAKLVKPKFLAERIDTTNSVHEYGLGYFLKWAAGRGAGFKGLQDAVFGATAILDGPLTAFTNQIASQVGGCPGAFADKYLCFAESLLTDPGSPLKNAAVTSAIAETAVQLSTAAMVVASDLTTGPYKAHVYAARVASTSGTRASRLIYSDASADCAFKAYLIPNDTAGGGRELAKATYDTETGFETVEANDGDALVLVATTETACTMHVEARDAAFCKITASCGGIDYECEDLGGVHQATLSTCEGTVAKYNYFTCQSVNGRPTCVEASFQADCANQGRTCGMLISCDPALPAC